MGWGGGLEQVKLFFYKESKSNKKIRGGGGKLGADCCGRGLK